jgi:hypothetical protein
MDLQPVQAWQVVQEAEVLRVRVRRPSTSFAPGPLAQAMREALGAQRVMVPPVSVQEVKSIPRGATSKAALISSAVNAPGVGDTNLPVE